MSNDVETQKKKAHYNEILNQATLYPPISVFKDTSGVLLGIYRLDGGKVRTLPVNDVERKRMELTANAGQDSREKI